MSAAPSPAPPIAASAASNRPKAARCSSTRSATCRSKRRRGFCGCLQQGEYTTVGGRLPIKTDVRIIAATNRDLRQLISQGLFREDLYYRLNVVPMRLPPLRERVEDIPDLVRHFLRKAEEDGLPAKRLEARRFELLKRYRWPGNVRELENVIRRLAVLHAGDTIPAAADGGRTERTAAPSATALATTDTAASLARRSSAIWPAISPAMATGCRRRASMTGWCRRWSGRCCRCAWPPPEAIRSGPPICWASTATPCARRSGIWAGGHSGPQDRLAAGIFGQPGNPVANLGRCILATACVFATLAGRDFHRTAKLRRASAGPGWRRPAHWKGPEGRLIGAADGAVRARLFWPSASAFWPSSRR